MLRLTRRRPVLRPWPGRRAHAPAAQGQARIAACHPPHHRRDGAGNRAALLFPLRKILLGPPGPEFALHPLVEALDVDDEPLVYALADRLALVDGADREGQ